MASLFGYQTTTPTFQGIEGGENPGNPPGGGGTEPPAPPTTTGHLQGMNTIDFLQSVFGSGQYRDPLLGQDPNGRHVNVDFSKMGNQFDPRFLDTMRAWLESLGIKMQYKPSDNGMPSGRITLPNGQTVDLNDRGAWGWILRGILTGGGGGGTSGGGGLFGRPSGLGEGAGNFIGDDLTGHTTFSDPATVEWEKMLRQMVARLQTPFNDPDTNQNIDFLRSYKQRLQGPAYTPQEMDLLNTQLIDPLTSDRDQARQRAIQWGATHGMDANSGPVQQMLMDSDRQYEQLRTRSRADVATKAIDIGRENMDKAVQIGAMLSAIQDQLFNKNEQRFGQSVDLMKQIPLYADTRLALAMQALGLGGGGAAAGVGNALNLMGSFQQSQGQDNTAGFWANLLKAGLGFGSAFL